MIMKRCSQPASTGMHVFLVLTASSESARGIILSGSGASWTPQYTVYSFSSRGSVYSRSPCLPVPTFRVNSPCRTSEARNRELRSAAGSNAPSKRLPGALSGLFFGKIRKTSGRRRATPALPGQLPFLYSVPSSLRCRVHLDIRCPLGCQFSHHPDPDAWLTEPLPKRRVPTLTLVSFTVRPQPIDSAHRFSPGFSLFLFLF
ncbi:hypothetical protein FA10DRAFT_181172 [Acaromyces ingoldii]|uniref:Uncharacterized protein n=1 Tax=Acaromyces ingoldii TaxID=215250 RepID=A0A316YEV8_9BASI|nr:hypothetical protein FA10DRAFT_181172 [Acaromyces ingoldii]PWN87957.1 hypothetical protein FA10DRAFT_181172 [Acaromyces ingoldii]